MNAFIMIGLTYDLTMQVDWTPYSGERSSYHPTAAGDSAFFERGLPLHCLGTCEPLFLELVVRTLGWHQPPLEFPSLGSVGHSRRRFFAEDRDWRQEHGDTVADWRAGGHRVTRVPELQDSSAYLTDYRACYGSRLRLDRRAVRLLTFMITYDRRIDY